MVAGVDWMQVAADGVAGVTRGAGCCWMKREKDEVADRRP